jgi:hypothetical protein
MKVAGNIKLTNDEVMLGRNIDGKILTQAFNYYLIRRIKLET